MLLNLFSFIELMIAFSFAVAISSFREHIEKALSDFVFNAKEAIKKTNDSLLNTRKELITTAEANDNPVLNKEVQGGIQTIDTERESVLKKWDDFKDTTEDRKKTNFFNKCSISNGFVGIFILILLSFFNEEDITSPLIYFVSTLALFQIYLTIIGTIFDISHKTKELVEKIRTKSKVLFACMAGVSLLLALLTVFIPGVRHFIIDCVHFIFVDFKQALALLIIFSLSVHFISYLSRTIIVIKRNYLGYNERVTAIDEIICSMNEQGKKFKAAAEIIKKYSINEETEEGDQAPE